MFCIQTFCSYMVLEMNNSTSDGNSLEDYNRDISTWESAASGRIYRATRWEGGGGENILAPKVRVHDTAVGVLTEINTLYLSS